MKLGKMMNKNDEVFIGIKGLLEKYKSFLLLNHVSPEGDALGSLLALYEVLESRNKEITAVNAHSIPKRYKFLPHSDRMLNLREYEVMTKGNGTPEVIIFLDCPNEDRAGAAKRIMSEEAVIVNIDHHPSNTYFGDINYVNPISSSTCQILYELFEEMNIKFNSSIAMNLYTGILTDTGGFRYSNTSASTHRIAARLLNEGVKPEVMFQLLYEQWPIERFKLLARVLDSMEVMFEGRCVFMSLTQEMLRETGTGEELSEDFVNYAMSISNVKVGVFLRENDECTKVAFRSKDNVNVNKIASKYGGGGHFKASGCKIKGDLEEVKKEVAQEIESNLDR